MDVSATLEKFTQSAPVNIEGLIEALGIKLERKGNLHPEIAGQIEAEGSGYKISVNRNDSYFRRRFTMAHELAHFLLHSDLIGTGVDDTVAYRSTNIGEFHNTKITSRHEAEANRMAAYILMPPKLVRAVHSEVGGDLAKLAMRFQVSKEAMGYRLQGLSLAQS